MANATRRKSSARELEIAIAAHAPLARLALDMLEDDSLGVLERAPLVAGARYGYEDLDLIQDEVPAYGLIDDLFVLAYGIDQVIKSDEAAAARYASRDIAGQPLSALLQGMRDYFYGFWEYCRQNTQSFFDEVEETLKEDVSFLPEAREAFRAEVDSIARNTAGISLQDVHVGQFLAQFRGFNEADLEA